MTPTVWSGIAMVAAGSLTVLINVGLTPFLQFDAPYAVTAASTVFVWRQSLSALAALLLLSGSFGIYLRHDVQSGPFRGMAFLFALVGNAMLFAHEWGQVFFIRGLALSAPEILEELDAAAGPAFFDVAAMIALVTFTLGWIAFASSMLVDGGFTRRGPLLVIAGFVAIPILSASLPGAWGAILANGVIGAGWTVLGSELLQSARARDVS